LSEENEEVRMTGKELQSSMALRKFLARLGAGAGVVGASVIASPSAVAQAAADGAWRLARHTQDDWYDRKCYAYTYSNHSSDLYLVQGLK
jgi:hypothetical protein